MVNLLGQVLKKGPAQSVILHVLVVSQLYHDRKTCCGLLTDDVKIVFVVVNQQIPGSVLEEPWPRRRSDEPQKSAPVVIGLGLEGKMPDSHGCTHSEFSPILVV